MFVQSAVGPKFLSGRCRVVTYMHTHGNAHNAKCQATANAVPLLTMLITHVGMLAWCVCVTKHGAIGNK